MHYGSEVIVMKKVENSKSVCLLQMLLLSSKSGIAKNELMIEETYKKVLYKIQPNMLS